MHVELTTQHNHLKDLSRVQLERFNDVKRAQESIEMDRDVLQSMCTSKGEVVRL